MHVYVVIKYHPAYETEILNVWATEELAQAQCDRLGANEHGWERYEVQGLPDG